MNVTEIESKTILRKSPRVDSWFISAYGMNLYRGCPHNCVYCDGRAETYRVQGVFGNDIEVKTNALDVLERELDPARKRKPLLSCYTLLGGGVGDCYNPLENKYRLTRRVLELLARAGRPVHALTKSVLIERDIDLFSEINHTTGAIVCMSFSSVDESLSALLEPGVPSPRKRLETLAAFKRRGVPVGMFLMPVVPLLTDSPEQIDDAVRSARDVGADFIIIGSMTLKPGRQTDHFHTALRAHGHDLVPAYRSIYGTSQYGSAFPSYADTFHRRFFDIASRYGVPVRVPRRLFERILSPCDRTIVMLEHIDYIHRLAGKKTSCGYYAHLIWKYGGEERETVRELFSATDTTPDVFFTGVDSERTFASIPKTLRDAAAGIYSTGTCEMYEKAMRFEIE